MSQEWRGHTYAIGSAALGAVYFCIGAYLVKTTRMPVRAFTGSLYLWATIFGFAGLAASGRGATKLDGARVRALLLLGLLFGGSVVLAFDAVRITDTTTTATLNRTNVFFALLLGFLVLGERLGAVEAVGGLLILAGVAGTFRVHGGLLARGPLEALGAALLTALYQLVAKRTMASVPAPVVNAYRNLCVLLLFWALQAVELVRGEPLEAVGDRWWIIVLAAFVGPFLHSQLNLMALESLDMVKASLLAQTQPVFVLAFASLALGDVPDRRAVVLDAVLLAGVVLLIKAGAARRKAAQGAKAAPASAREQPASR